METGVQITIVIGTLNRPLVALSLLKQLDEISLHISLEVITVDQSSLVHWKQLETQFPKKNNFTLVHFVPPHTCKYLNYGWRHASAPIVLYLDDDVTVTQKTIQSHIDAYKNHSIKGVAGRVINEGEEVSKEGEVGKILWYGAVFTKNFSSEKETFVDYPYGCNMSFRKNVLEEVGGFDENLSPPIYSFNEVDLGYRISKTDKNSLLFLPEALVYHHQYKKGGTRNDFELNQVIKSNNFNYGYFLGKNFTWGENIVCFLRRLPYQLLKESSAIPSIISGYLSSHATRGESNKKKEV